MIRLYDNETDFEALKRIHEKFYKDEFSLNEFMRNFLSLFTASNDKNEIISVAGVRPILEVVAVTDKDKTLRERQIALGDEILGAASLVAKVNGYMDLHAFVQEDNWIRVMKNRGFRDCKGRALVFTV